MFRLLDDFLACWAKESEATLKVLAAIPDEAANTQVSEGHRDLKRMAWHVVESLIEMPGRWGITINGKFFMTPSGFIGAPPATMDEIRNVYTKASESLVNNLASWSDETLSQEDDMYGESWKRGLSLYVLIIHQAHHRGQMTVLMRQAGLQVPNIYGPAKEGWGAYNLEAPLV